MQQSSESKKEMSSSETVNVFESNKLAENKPVGLRGRLQKMFPLLPTIEERRSFLWFLGNKLKEDESPERYIGSLAFVVTCKVSLLFGIPLLAFLEYLAYKGLDAYAYTAVIYSQRKSLQSTGIVGLFVYYYAKIMAPVVWIISLLCFALFLIYMKRDDVVRFRARLYNSMVVSGTVGNLTNLFLFSVLMIAMGVVLTRMLDLSILTIINTFFGMHDPTLTGSLFWGIFTCLAGVVGQMSLAVCLYIGLTCVCSIIFGYDKTYNRR